jgi:hypothetical protein
MSEYTNNAEANVSAAKGVVGGYCYRAPIGTTLPDGPDWTPAPVYTLTEDTEVDSNKTYYTRSGSGTDQSPYVYTEVASPLKANLGTYYEKSDPWTCMGYVNEDGETFSTTSDITEFRDKNGDVIDTSQNNYGETFTCSYAETKAATFQSIYGDDSVTDEGGVLTVNHTGAEPGSYTYAWLFLLKNGRKWVRYAEKAKRTSIGDVQTNSSNLLSWNATYQVIRSENTGGYFVDLFESTETEA